MHEEEDVVDVAVLVNEEEAEVKIYLFDQIFKFHKFIIYLFIIQEEEMAVVMMIMMMEKVTEEEAEVKIYLFDQIFKFHKFIIYLLFSKRRWQW